MIFVFGSNLAGRHGKGAALSAVQQHGAIYGQGVGRQGNAYAIPTKNHILQTLPLNVIEMYVKDFLMYATVNPELTFAVTRIGCGLAGYTDTQIAPMFANASKNCALPPGWRVEKIMKLAVTGHRPQKLGGFGEHVESRLIDFAQRMLTFYKPSEVITGMAMGWDMAVAYAAHGLRIPYVAAVPFLGQESRWHGSVQMRYNGLLQNAKSVHVVCTGGYEAWKMQARNEWMVNNCDVLVALWDGSSGGTGNCVAYAQRVGKPIKQVWGSWIKFNGGT